MLPPFVENKQLSWLIYNEAKSWTCRPSELLDIDDWYIGYCLDQAINYWGTFVTSELDKLENKDSKTLEAMRRSRLKGLLSPEGEVSAGKFADPALLFK